MVKRCNNDDKLAPAVGIINGIVLSIPFWVVVFIILIKLFK